MMHDGQVAHRSRRPLTALNPTYFRDCGSLQVFGTPKHYYFFSWRPHGNDSPTISSFLMIPKLNFGTGVFSTQTLGFLTDVVSLFLCWSLIGGSPQSKDASCSIPLPRYVVVTFCPSFHLTSMLIGWFNLIQKGYRHHGISIGNLLMVEDVVTTKASRFLKKSAGMRQ